MRYVADLGGGKKDKPSKKEDEWEEADGFKVTIGGRIFEGVEAKTDQASASEDENKNREYGFLKKQGRTRCAVANLISSAYIGTMLTGKGVSLRWGWRLDCLQPQKIKHV